MSEIKYHIIPQIPEKKHWWNKEPKEPNWYRLRRYNSHYPGSSYNATSRNTLAEIEKDMDKFKAYDKLPKYRVFKLGSGEFTVMEKGDIQLESDDENSVYHNILFKKIDNNTSAILLEEVVYHQTLQEACEKLLELEKIESRNIKEPVECV